MRYQTRASDTVGSCSVVSCLTTIGRAGVKKRAAGNISCGVFVAYHQTMIVSLPNGYWTLDLTIRLVPSQNLWTSHCVDVLTVIDSSSTATAVFVLLLVTSWK